MIKLTKFETANEVERIAAEMEELFTTDLGGLGGLLAPCHSVFSELAENVVTHSGSGGYVLAHRFEYRKGPVIDIAVGDCGIGLRRSLRKNPGLEEGLEDDTAAIVMAMRDGVSRLAGDPHRGYGLGHVRAELSARRRSLTLRSGSAQAYWREGKRVWVNECRGSIGTVAHAVIPC